MMCLFILTINSLGFLIYHEIINPVVKLKNDKGLMIWWMCCLKFGISKKKIVLLSPTREREYTDKKTKT